MNKEEEKTREEINAIQKHCANPKVLPMEIMRAILPPITKSKRFTHLDGGELLILADYLKLSRNHLKRHLQHTSNHSITQYLLEIASCYKEQCYMDKAAFFLSCIIADVIWEHNNNEKHFFILPQYDSGGKS